MNTPVDCITRDPAGSVPLTPLTPATLGAFRAGLAPREAAWVSATGFAAGAGSVCLLPGADGSLAGVLAGADLDREPFALGDLPQHLPAGRYRLPAHLAPALAERAALGFALGGYRFTRYRSAERREVELVVEPEAAAERVLARARAVYLARDLINTPAGDMMPSDLADAAAALAQQFGARVHCVVGEDLLREGFPAIHAVGRASACAPRLIRLDWGRDDAPRVALIGKGVCFDTGGLDIKPASGMRLMKKDMGGAAHALALARLVMDTGLDVRLQVLVPAVENAISGNALRPGDVIATRQGMHVEVDNTDAEGRLILCDAITLACESEPALLVDFATLTGAARVAVGTELAALFCNDEDLAAGILAGAGNCADPVWRMPLHAPYRKLLESQVADLANASGTPYAGAITAALFLESFVTGGVPWAHFDVMAWNPRPRPGHPEGGEAMGVRAVFDDLESRFGR